ncbi:hypothetical protein FHP25_30515 [Vineibacter terrae]|uniref:Lipoprotein n=1 Tax=Vineibacter terrae TaxID=2586908 RepID=A0A5C8PCJ9_9HYPH|nr:hypothetical protein [Vineibacter terrae]TXL71299.1 hypothetical protein FHP25_30515 [Vineibacter terrae]
MRSHFTRILAASVLVITGPGLSACVSDGYDRQPRYSYGYNPDYSYRYKSYVYNDGYYQSRRWVDRDRDGRRDWWEYRR